MSFEYMNNRREVSRLYKNNRREVSRLYIFFLDAVIASLQTVQQGYSSATNSQANPLSVRQALLEKYIGSNRAQ